jgi:hypothetical protein
VTVHLRERELLAQSVAVPVVSVDVDRPFVQKCIVQTVQLLANRFLLPLDGGDSLLRFVLQSAGDIRDAEGRHEAPAR